MNLSGFGKVKPMAAEGRIKTEAQSCSVDHCKGLSSWWTEWCFWEVKQCLASSFCGEGLLESQSRCGGLQQSPWDFERKSECDPHEKHPQS